MMAGAARLTRAASRYRVRRGFAAGALALGSGALAASIATRAGVQSGAALIAGGIVVLGVAAWHLWRERRRRVTANLVARHLDRTVPALEDSAELLLSPPETLTFVGRLERRRVESAIGGIGSLPPLPDRRARWMSMSGLAAAALGLGLLLAPRSAATPPGRAATVARVNHTAHPSIDGAEISIAPPAYTGLATRRQQDWDVEAPEGATVTWLIRADADQLVLTTSAGDTLALPSEGDRFRAVLHAGSSVLYQLAARRGTDLKVSDYHRLTVRPDEPPLIAVLRPPVHQYIAAGEPPRVVVDVAAGDDYGVAGAHLVATVTSGEGEAVKFREQTIALAAAGARPGPHGVLYRAQLDLAALGLKPGDELYFHAEAVDRRAPTPNVSRSETVFITLLDSTRAPMATIAGVTLRLTPEYFRSQRQVIIDTEKLLAERARLTDTTFRRRSNDIGIDQSLLRTRYGTLAGDETESEEGSPEIHQHDTPENATLLAASVKSKLRVALSEMWEAEIRLRTYRPLEALPYEHRALDRLKEAQQSARVYVQKVGFSPPPLDPGRTRLTGKLDGVTSRAARDSMWAAPLRPAIRAALAALTAASDDTPLGVAALAQLAGAESELAPLAATNATTLETLRDVRALLDRARSGGRCDGCRASVIRGLWQALPDSTMRTPTRTRAATGPMARRYFERLDSAR